MFGKRSFIVTLLLAFNIRAQSVGEAVAYHEGKVYYPAKEPVPQPEIREPIIIDERVKQSQTTVSAATEPSPLPQQPASFRNATMLNSTMITAPPLLANVNASDNATQYRAASSKNDSTNSTNIADSQNDTDKEYTAPVRDEVSSGSAVVTSLLYSSALLAMMLP
ncbi:hypothetical protein MIR68_001110 [Amoeboaphelidium protococcarum]|nr:hypothetical protein MIR68_001110 [Amoeboaphelidium protococcarum]